MKKLLLSSAILATFALFTACGDDSSSGPEEESSSSIEVEDKSSSSVEEEGKSSAADKKSSSSEAKKGDSSSSEEATSSSSEAESSSSIAEESSSSNVIASSSSAKQSSSSEEESSSSVVFPEGVMSAGYYENHCPAGHDCRDAAPSTYLKSGITYGEILDTRDGQVYKVVTIGEGANAQVWMAQNLNYEVPFRDYEDTLSYCYDDDLDKCSKYGRLYTWAAAVEACPSGWHLPSQYEYDVLINYIDNSYAKEQSGYRYSTSAGLYLKSEKDWFRMGNGYDTYGFSALPAGRRDGSGGFSYAFGDAYFWSASEYDCDYAYIINLFYLYESAYVNYSSKYNAFSVRCLKD